MQKLPIYANSCMEFKEVSWSVNGETFTDKEAFEKRIKEIEEEARESAGHLSGLVKIQDKESNKVKYDISTSSLLFRKDTGVSRVVQFRYQLDNDKVAALGPYTNNIVKKKAFAQQFQNYRRVVLDKELNLDVNIKILPRHKVLLLSDPSIRWLEYGKQNGLKVIYDRSDAWYACASCNQDHSSDLECIKNADCVVCSSKWLYEHTSNPNKKYIPNRFIYQEYKRVQKHAKPTAIYAGMYTFKLDFDYISKLIESNPDIDFKFYVSPTDPWPKSLDKYKYKPLSVDEIFNEMLKCHYALLPLNSSDWAAGMLTLKTFQYLNAHLPILCSDVWKGFINMDGLPNVYRISADTKISDIDMVLKPFGKWDWSSVIESMIETIGQYL